MCLLVFGAGAIAAPPEANVPRTCDPEFYEVLRAQAWLQASRDNETAEVLIRKPDSVLQYSCFTPSLVDGFSSITRFTSPEYGDAMAELVDTPALTYLDTNYQHAPGGGSVTNMAFSPCYSMQAVWHEIKCQNFDKNLFRRFSEFEAEDLRLLPEPCDGDRGEWTTNIEVANPPAAEPPEFGGVQALVTFLPRMVSYYGGGCGAPIYTGVITVGGRLDAVCGVPSCYYTGGACSF